MPPVRRALGAALLVVPMLLTASATAKDCGTRRLDGWVATTTGAFPSGDPILTALAVLPRNPDTMVVSNGAALKVSKDAGCTWSPVTLPAGGLLSGLGGGGVRKIVDVTTSHPRTGVETVWVLANETGAVSRPTVFRSTDGGTTFTLAETGLPPVGDASAIAAGIDDRTAYVVADLPSPLGRRLFATTDGGASWTSKAPTAEFPYENVVVDTVNTSQVYAWNSDTLAKSFDSGATWTAVDLKADGLIRDVALGQAPRGSRLAVLLEGGRLQRSDDGGRSWTSRKVGLVAERVAAAPDLDAVAISGPDLVTLLPSVFADIDASPDGAQPLDLSLGLVSGSEVRMVGRVDTDVLTFVGKGPKGSDLLLGFDLRAARLTVPVDPAIVPARTEVALAPGETKVVDYEFDVPTTPSPIEVFFLIDTTGSMGGVITGVREGLVKMVNDLAAAGIASQFGVGEVKDYPFETYGGSGDLPYKLFRKVGPVDDELAEALSQLQASGGGDGPEAMPTGFYQLATGEGQEVNGVEVVPRGDDAGFSGRTMSIVIASTDTSYHREESYPGPAPEKAYAALRAKRIKVIGLAAAPGEAVRDLSETAEATGTFAPENGVDCDLDGKDELAEGDPLVCEITGGAAVNVEIGSGSGPIVDTGGTAGIGGAIVSLLRQIHDPAVLTLHSSVPDVAKVLGNPAVPVDLKVPHAVPYRVRLSCPAARYGSTVNVRLAGNAGQRELAAAGINVRCLAPERPPSEPVLDKVPRPLAAAAAVPPAPPVQPVNNLQPNMNPQPNPNTQMQAGVAQQEQQEFQVALALGDLPGMEEGEELAMVGREQPSPALPAVAAMTAAAAAWGVAFRTGPMAAYVRRRRPY